jgi:hypothetical protein
VVDTASRASRWRRRLRRPWTPRPPRGEMHLSEQADACSATAKPPLKDRGLTEGHSISASAGYLLQRPGRSGVNRYPNHPDSQPRGGAELHGTRHPPLHGECRWHGYRVGERRYRDLPELTRQGKRQTCTCVIGAGRVWADKRAWFPRGDHACHGLRTAGCWMTCRTNGCLPHSAVSVGRPRHAAMRNASSCLSHRTTGFQLANVWLTTNP